MARVNPPHPGEIISGILEDLGVGSRQLAAVLGSTPEMWMRL